MTKKLRYLAALFTVIYFPLKAQEANSVSSLAFETRLTTYLQNGFDAAVFYYPSQSKFSFGAIFATHDISGNTRSLVFESNNHDGLSIRLAWLAGMISRYHLSENRKGFFGEVGVGLEAFDVHVGQHRQLSPNGFISPAVGYMWYPWKAAGFYVLPKITANFIVGRGNEQRERETTYRLRPVFPAPSLAIGWKF